MVRCVEFRVRMTVPYIYFRYPRSVETCEVMSFGEFLSTSSDPSHEKNNLSFVGTVYVFVIYIHQVTATRYQVPGTRYTVYRFSLPTRFPTFVQYQVPRPMYRNQQPGCYSYRYNPTDTLKLGIGYTVAGPLTQHNSHAVNCSVDPLSRIRQKHRNKR